MTIELEFGPGSIDGNRDWTDYCQTLLQCVFISHWQELIPRAACSLVLWVILAHRVLNTHRIALDCTILLQSQIFTSRFHQTTISGTFQKTHLACVGIGFIRVNAVVFHDIQEGVGHEATVAAVVSEPAGAVDQVLWTQRLQDAPGLLQLPLQSPDCAEGPTRTTGTLHRAPQAQHSTCTGCCS